MLNAEVINSVAIGNLKAISEQPAMLSNLAYSNVVSTSNLGQQNAVANQQAVGELGISITAKGSNTVSNSDPLTARSAVDILTNNELAQTIADLKAVLQEFSSENGRKGHSGWFAELIKLIKRGIRFKDGHLQVPAGVSIFVPGNYSRESIVVTLESNGVYVKVTPST
ncbi:hypothetical protein [Nitrosomonas sp.]|uniref:hypothetical protein n=1 Tax=Nitrosomonas sp. TaxID=42353 RepID=UPI0025E366DD|nr:hypothetical protein [Nitrosomonas sp.]MBS0587215.1 hypothetical protein [Pseudomonadota bacterium]MBV6447888.1 hypothetical protein [Nitrosomonas sp.]HNB02228.1 hypothetical protein [Nitrosomonas sp.]